MYTSDWSFFGKYDLPHLISGAALAAFAWFAYNKPIQSNTIPIVMISIGLFWLSFNEIDFILYHTDIDEIEAVQAFMDLFLWLFPFRYMGGFLLAIGILLLMNDKLPTHLTYQNKYNDLIENDGFKVDNHGFENLPIVIYVALTVGFVVAIMGFVWIYKRIGVSNNDLIWLIADLSYLTISFLMVFICWLTFTFRISSPIAALLLAVFGALPPLNTFFMSLAWFLFIRVSLYMDVYFDMTDYMYTLSKLNVQAFQYISGFMLLTGIIGYRHQKRIKKIPESASQEDWEALQVKNALPISISDLLFSFHGRISRSTFWFLYSLPILLIEFILMAIDMASGTYFATTNSGIGLFSGFFLLLTFYPSLAVSVKRCHDRDRSGWFLLVSFIPIIGSIWVLFELGFLKGTKGRNRYGEDPLREASFGPKSAKSTTAYQPVN